MFIRLCIICAAVSVLMRVTPERSCWRPGPVTALCCLLPDQIKMQEIQSLYVRVHAHVCMAINRCARLSAPPVRMLVTQLRAMSAGAHPVDAPHEGHRRHAAAGLHRRLARRRRRGPVYRTRPAGVLFDPS